jgi:hypothetical protein
MIYVTVNACVTKLTIAVNLKLPQQNWNVPFKTDTAYNTPRDLAGLCPGRNTISIHIITYNHAIYIIKHIP